MEYFKRNQIEDAIARVSEKSATKPSRELHTRIKRLLQTDRALPMGANSSNGEIASSAFFSEASPGKGNEIHFSAYEAFAISIGLILMQHGWPQRFAVRVLRQVRPHLEVAYSTTLAQDPEWLFDEEEILRDGRPGAMIFNNQDPYLLLIVTVQGSGGRNLDEETIICGVRRGQAAAWRFIHENSGGRGMWTAFDIVGLAHDVAAALTKTKPQLRGRNGGEQR